MVQRERDRNWRLTMRAHGLRNSYEACAPKRGIETNRCAFWIGSPTLFLHKYKVRSPALRVSTTEIPEEPIAYAGKGI